MATGSIKERFYLLPKNVLYGAPFSISAIHGLPTLFFAFPLWFPPLLMSAA
jgi:hypothetical protein